MALFDGGTLRADSFLYSTMIGSAKKVKLPAIPLRRDRHRVKLPGNVNMITGSASLPAAHPADLPVT